VSVAVFVSRMVRNTTSILGHPGISSRRGGGDVVGRWWAPRVWRKVSLSFACHCLHSLFVGRCVLGHVLGLLVGGGRGVRSRLDVNGSAVGRGNVAEESDLKERLNKVGIGLAALSSTRTMIIWARLRNIPPAKKQHNRAFPVQGRARVCI
jgi:hypothetical protein